MRNLFTIGLFYLTLSTFAQGISGNTTDSTAAATSVSEAPSLVVIQPIQKSVSGTVHQGLDTRIAASKATTRKAWKKYLSTYGKVVRKGDLYQIDNARIPGVSSSPLRVVSTVSGGGSGSSDVFVSLQNQDAGEYVLSGASQEFLRNFVLQTYRQQESRQVMAAQKDLKKAQKNADQLNNRQQRLQQKLERERKNQLTYERKARESQEMQVKLTQQLTEMDQKKVEAAQELDKARTQVNIQQTKLDRIK